MTFATGDIVGLYDTGGCATDSQVGTGIVTRVSQASISVAFDDPKDGISFDTDAVYNLLKLANDVTYKRMKKSVTSRSIKIVCNENCNTEIMRDSNDNCSCL